METKKIIEVSKEEEKVETDKFQPDYRLEERPRRDKDYKKKRNKSKFDRFAHFEF